MTAQAGCARVSKADDGRGHDLRCDALVATGVDPAHIHDDTASGRLDPPPALEACLKALRRGDTLVIWRPDRIIGRALIVGRTRAGLACARARGRAFKMTTAKRETRIADRGVEPGVTRQTLYRHVTLDGQIRPDGEKLLTRERTSA